MGKEITTMGINGEDMIIQIPEGVKHNQKVVVEGAGFYSLSREKRGDHIINVELTMPKRQTEK